MNQEKIAIITGISRGLGRVIANKFAENQYQVFGTGRSERPADLPENINYQSVDMSNFATVSELIENITKSHQNATFVLVNNAGGFVGGSLSDAHPEDYLSMINSCYIAAVNATKAFTANVDKGRIINVISAISEDHFKGVSAYGSAKAASKYFFQTIRKELDAKAFPITNLYPDMINSYGNNPKGINAGELAAIIFDNATTQKSYYIPEMTIFANS